MTELSDNAITVLRRRYLKKDEDGSAIETPEEMFKRVASNIASADELYDGKDVKKTEEDFYRIMTNLEFLPNSPTLMNAGTELQQLAACFVLPVEDSIEGIFETLKNAALIHQSGGGTGFSFSHLRPKGDIVKSTGGIASGPVSFMKVFDAATQAIKQGGKRRGANMGTLRVDHPDIIEFITVKKDTRILTNFNISVAVTEEFIDALKEGEKYNLISPRTNEIVGKLNAEEVFDLMVEMAWSTGDPGIIFLDRINKDNPTPQLGEMESTNPCGEQPLLPYEACNLGSINLSKMVKNGEIDFEKLGEVVDISIKFLDNVIDKNEFPLDSIKEVVKGNRKIGLGVMGFADMLVKLRIPYNSEKALEIAERVMKFISERGKRKSMEIAKERGPFSNYEESIKYDPDMEKVRNSTRTTVAPTGTISIIAGCSSGIEPFYAISYVRRVLDDERLYEVNHLFEEIAKERGFYNEELMEKIAEKGSVKGMSAVPEDIQELFVTAYDISPEWQVKMQAAFQKYVDNAVSKTVNLPQEATKDDVRRIFLLAYELGCKGITVYRDKSKEEQTLAIEEKVPVEECPDCGEELKFIERTDVCIRCGYTTSVS